MRFALPFLLAALSLCPVAAFAADPDNGMEVQEPDADENTTDVPPPAGGEAATLGMYQPTPQQPVAQTPPIPGQIVPGQLPVAGQPIPPELQEKPPQGIPVAPAPGEGGDTNFESVALQGINKVTARTQAIDAAIGGVTRYGTIEITAHKCWKSAPGDRPENAALLEIAEVKQGEAPQRIFSGWMFSSTPGLSALEHPFYDISVTGCNKGAEHAAPAETPAVAAPKKK